MHPQTCFYYDKTVHPADYCLLFIICYILVFALLYTLQLRKYLACTSCRLAVLSELRREATRCFRSAGRTPGHVVRQVGSTWGLGLQGSRSTSHASGKTLTQANRAINCSWPQGRDETNVVYSCMAWLVWNTIYIYVCVCNHLRPFHTFGKGVFRW
jgi:hypothetical protein